MKSITNMFFTSTILVVAFALVMVSCDKEEAEVPPPTVDQSELPGNWSLIEAKSENGKFSTTIANVPVSGNYTITGKDYTAKINFTKASNQNETNNFTSTGGLTLNTTVVVPFSEDITFEQAFPDLFGAGQWVIEGTRLTTTAAGVPVSYEIVMLSSNKLILKKDIEESTTQQGYDISLTGVQVLVFSK